MAKKNNNETHVMGQGETLTMRVKRTLFAVIIGAFFYLYL